MARNIGKRYSWVVAELALMQIRIEQVFHYDGGPLVFYAPCIQMYLRLKAAEVPLSGVWVTRNEIIRILDCGLTWRTAEKLLKPFKHYAKKRRGFHNRIHWCYPPCILVALRGVLYAKLMFDR
jgi:hypothetical protein